LPRIFAGMGNAIRPLVIGRDARNAIPEGALV
jgi:hypothetical protein